MPHKNVWCVFCKLSLVWRLLDFMNYPKDRVFYQDEHTVHCISPNKNTCPSKNICALWRLSHYIIQLHSQITISKHWFPFVLVSQSWTALLAVIVQLGYMVNVLTKLSYFVKVYLPQFVVILAHFVIKLNCPTLQ